MANITSIVKDGNHLVETYDDGTVVRRSIIKDDTVVSVPLEGYKEVGNIYINASGELIVNYNGQSITLTEGAGAGVGDMLKSIYDTDEDGVVDNSEKLEGSTEAEVQDHNPKAHLLGAHSADTLANLNTKVSDATLLDQGSVVMWAIVFGG